MPTSIFTKGKLGDIQVEAASLFEKANERSPPEEVGAKEEFVVGPLSNGKPRLHSHPSGAYLFQDA